MYSDASNDLLLAAPTTNGVSGSSAPCGPGSEALGRGGRHHRLLQRPPPVREPARRAPAPARPLLLQTIAGNPGVAPSVGPSEPRVHLAPPSRSRASGTTAPRAATSTATAPTPASRSPRSRASSASSARRPSRPRRRGDGRPAPIPRRVRRGPPRSATRASTRRCATSPSSGSRRFSSPPARALSPKPRASRRSRSPPRTAASRRRPRPRSPRPARGGPRRARSTAPSTHLASTVGAARLAVRAGERAAARASAPPAPPPRRAGRGRGAGGVVAAQRRALEALARKLDAPLPDDDGAAAELPSRRGDGRAPAAGRGGATARGRVAAPGGGVARAGRGDGDTGAALPHRADEGLDLLARGDAGHVPRAAKPWTSSGCVTLAGTRNCVSALPPTTSATG